jgi:YD repeat-containing protein
MLLVIKDMGTVARIVLHYDPATTLLLAREYDGLDETTGRLEEIVVTKFSYDSAGRLLSAISFIEDEVFGYKYVYDSAGNMLSETYLSGEKENTMQLFRKVIYEYDNKNRLVKSKIHNEVTDGTGTAYYSTVPPSTSIRQAPHRPALPSSHRSLSKPRN